MGVHHPTSICLILSAVIAFAVTCFFNGIAATGIGIKWGLFYNTTGALSDKYYIEITPARWTFSIWGVIYVWQALFLIYAMSTICRKGPNHGYLHYDSELIPGIVYLLYVINMALNIIWLFLWDREYIIPAFVVLALTACTLYIMLFFTCRAVVKYGPEFIKSGMKKEIWFVRIFVHNAFGIYAAWTSIATLLNLAVMLTYVHEISLKQEISSTICLGILVVEVLLYPFLDILPFDHYLRYLLTPYLVIPVALVGSLTKNWSKHDRNSILTLVLLVISGILLAVKLVVMTLRFIKKPIFKEDDVKIKPPRAEEEMRI